MASNHDEVEIQTSIKKTWIWKMIHLFHLSLQFFRELDKRLTSQGLVRYPESSHCTDLNINDFVFVRRMYLSELENVFPGSEGITLQILVRHLEPSHQIWILIILSYQPSPKNTWSLYNGRIHKVYKMYHRMHE